MATSLQAFVSRETLFAFCIVGIVVTTCITLLRVYVRIKKQRLLREDDYALLAAYAFYVTLASLYIADIPYLYAVMDWLEHKVPFNPMPVEAYAQMMRFNFAVTLFFWTVLWAVKLSLLLFFRRVIQHTNWLNAWWAISIFTGLTFVGCVTSQFCSCDSIPDFTALGHCNKPRNTRAQIISLYYSFSADVITDFAIMALPLRIVSTLKMARRDKWILAGLFSVTAIAIVTSIIRVFLIWAKTGNTTPSPSWLGLWAVIECMVAIIVGCIPSISQIFRNVGQVSPAHSGSSSKAKPRFHIGLVPSGLDTQRRPLEDLTPWYRAPLTAKSICILMSTASGPGQMLLSAVIMVISIWSSLPCAFSDVLADVCHEQDHSRGASGSPSPAPARSPPTKKDL